MALRNPVARMTIAVLAGLMAAAAAGPPPALALAQTAPSTTTAAAKTSALAWGDNSAGELGNATLTPSTTPTAITTLQNAQAIAAGGRHNLALLSDGTVMAWGDNTFGQLGNGTTGTNNDAETPVAVKGLSGVIAIASGGEHSLALLSNGRVMAWGDNTQGQLGDGTTTNRDIPVAVMGLSGVTGIAAGQLFSMAVLSNGTVMTWGSNNSGQLGIGNNTDSKVPVLVTGLTGVKAVAAGDQHALALLTTGTAEAWGANDAGELGDGDSTHGSSPVPVKVKQLTGATAITAGSEHSVALLKSGTVMAWGGNGFFQLARLNGFPGGVGSSNLPLVIPGIKPAKAVVAGGLFTLTVTTTGNVQAWGDNAFGQLGNNSTTSNETPITVPGLSHVSAVAAGGVHSMALVAGTASSRAADGVTSSIWRVQPTQNPGPPSAIVDLGLEAVSSAAANDAWSVGTNSLVSPRPLAEHWNGTAWKTVTVPMPTGAAQATLHGVDDLSPTNAWAVGVTQDPTAGNQRTLIEHWDGTKWTVIPSPNPEVGSGAFDELKAVGGIGPKDLWAVGDFSNGINFIGMLFEHWDGTAWTFVPPPSVGTDFATAVAAISSNDVWVVGDTAQATESAHWDGHAWKFIQTPILMDGIAPQNFLTGVTATGPNDVWASGYEDNVNQQNLADPYTLHWTGTQWTLTKIPDPGTEGSRLRGVTALSPTDVWTVGTTGQTDGALLSLTEHFDGTAWTVAPSLDPGQLAAIPDSSLNAISNSGNHTLFTVGAQETPGRCCVLTLAEGTTAG
jgi:alpha-tubulin suppressor-like RCC1 family protein